MVSLPELGLQAVSHIHQCQLSRATVSIHTPSPSRRPPHRHATSIGCVVLKLVPRFLRIAASQQSTRAITAVHTGSPQAVNMTSSSYLICTMKCPPLCVGALLPMPAWVWHDVRSLFFPVKKVTIIPSHVNVNVNVKKNY